MVWSWAPLLNQKSRYTKPPASSFLSKKLLHNKHLHPSLGMAMELHSPCKRDSPQRRPFWEAFEKRYHGRAGRAGFALSRDRAAIWSIGDNVFFSNTLLLPHWASHFPCWNCDGQNFAESAEGKHVREKRMRFEKFLNSYDYLHRWALEKGRNYIIVFCT